MNNNNNKKPTKTQTFISLLEEAYQLEYEPRMTVFAEKINPFLNLNDTYKSINPNLVPLDLLYSYLHDKLHEQRYSKDWTVNKIFPPLLRALKPSRVVQDKLNTPHPYDDRTLLEECMRMIVPTPFVIDVLINHHHLTVTDAAINLGLHTHMRFAPKFALPVQQKSLQKVKMLVELRNKTDFTDSIMNEKNRQDYREYEGTFLPFPDKLQNLLGV